MGPRSDERGEDNAIAVVNGVCALQWGRALMSAESREARRVRGVDVVASLGPRSDERGEKLGRMVALPPGESLQWGRALMSAESGARGAAGRRGVLHRFNGAAL